MRDLSQKKNAAEEDIPTLNSGLHTHVCALYVLTHTPTCILPPSQNAIKCKIKRLWLSLLTFSLVHYVL